ncbi:MULTISPECIES: alpha/beta hydrolase family protein [unclassified Sinorhizobium]|uniref:alpha/beta hydrolase family protein n=1 Tax=unclassified Sinorhizobium TaxID=2613772 RepID=UPI003524086F
MRALSIAAIGLLLAMASSAAAAGFQSVTVPDADDKPLNVGVWYPTNSPLAKKVSNVAGQFLAVDGAVKGDHLSLVVISHGNGGGILAHADTAEVLADSGFVVAAVVHTGDNGDDKSYPASRWSVDRPRHISRVIDFMLYQWGGRSRIDAERIGVFGFSAGGFAALVAAGGIPNPALAASHCRELPGEVACQLGMVRDFGKPSGGKRDPSIWRHDPRIKAAVIASPGFGFAFDDTGLANVKVPIQLWAASDDDNVPYASNAGIVRQNLPTEPDFHMVEGVGHFAFARPCNRKLEPHRKRSCVDSPSFNQTAFHAQFNEGIRAFFENALSPHH